MKIFSKVITIETKFILFFWVNFFFLIYGESLLNQLTAPFESILNLNNQSSILSPLLNLLKIDSSTATYSQDPPKQFDYIVIGAGAAGCPLAFTLADAGYNTLLIERGPGKNDPITRATDNINGLSKSINKHETSELVITTQGIRTHIPKIMGGGTSINFAIYTEEISDYFDYLETFPNVTFDRNLFKNSTDWVYERVASDMPQNDTFNIAWRNSMDRLGFKRFTSSTGSNPENDYSRTILLDHQWGGMSLFNSSNNYHRRSADELLYYANGTIPQKLTIMTNKKVKKILFDTSTATPKAQCIEYHDSVLVQDKNLIKFNGTLLSLFNIDWNQVLNYTFNPSMIFNYLFNNNSNKIYKACIADTQGEIILSSGTVMSPVVLFNSGIGPKSQLQELNVPIVHEIPQLGQNFSDRIFVPIVVFLKEDNPSKKFYNGKICRGIGLKHFGNNCTNYKIGDTNYGCSLVSVEEFSGAYIGESLLYATRYAFPPKWRQHPILEFVVEVLNNCGEGKSPFNNLLFQPLCYISSAILDCLRRTTGNFYFTTEPKSRGSVKVDSNGFISLDANYLSNDQDFFDAIRGTSALVEQINGPEFRNITEHYSLDLSCPAKIYNSFFDLIIGLTHYLDSSFLASSQGYKDVRTLFDQNSYDEFHIKREEFEKMNDEILSRHLGTSSELQDSDDFGLLLKELEKIVLEHTQINKDGSFQVSDELETRLSNLKSNNRLQWAATFPPTLPNPKDAREVGKYVLSTMSSIWHHSGTAQMGQVVNHNFSINGLDGISVVDASVLNQITRLNPTASLLSLGRYAGLMKVNARQLTTSL